jgi:broad specificity phosphatase PhoE
MHALRRSFLAVLSTLSVVSCSRSHPPADVLPVVGEPVQSLVLEVENHNWSDIVVFVTHDGVSSRLSQVTANANLKLPIPPYLVGSQGIVRLSVRRIGGNDSFASEPLSVRTGSTLRLTVESRVSGSSVAVW